MGNSRNIIDFSHLHRFGIDEIGEKAHQIGTLKHLGISIPDGFAIRVFEHLSLELIKEIHQAYGKLSGILKEESVNIFTSYLSNKSVMFPDIKGDANLIHKVKTILLSQTEKTITIIVQKNIKPETKGVIYTINPPKELEHVACKIQKHFYFPQEINYAVKKGKTYITSVKPLTNLPKAFIRKILAQGISIKEGIATGPARILLDQDFTKIKNEEILVLSKFNLAMFTKIKKAKAVVSDSAILSNRDKMIYKRLLQIPSIHNAKNATKKLYNGNIITVNGATGEIYSGGLI